MSTNALQFWAFSRVISQYVTRIYEVNHESTDHVANVPNRDRLIGIETLDWCGRRRVRSTFVRDCQLANTGQLLLKPRLEKLYLDTSSLQGGAMSFLEFPK